MPEGGRDRPRLDENQTLLSPVVLAGPPRLAFKKPVVVSFGHCANLRSVLFQSGLSSAHSNTEKNSILSNFYSVNPEMKTYLLIPGFWSRKKDLAVGRTRTYAPRGNLISSQTP